MTPLTIPDNASLLSSHVKVPQHVVYRSFPTETVMLNLQTGRYHGLNPTAGEALRVLERGASVHEAATAIAALHAQPQLAVEGDLCALCSALLKRGLIELDDRTAP